MLAVPQKMVNSRYEDLNHWMRVDLACYAISLTHKEELRWATKIRIIGEILNAEWGI